MSRSKSQRGPLLSSVVMVMLATAATGLLAVIGFQALPDTVIPSTFRDAAHETRKVDVTETPSTPPAKRPVSVSPAATGVPSDPEPARTGPNGRGDGGTDRAPSNGSSNTHRPAPAATTAPSKPKATTTAPKPPAPKPKPKPTATTPPKTTPPSPSPSPTPSAKPPPPSPSPSPTCNKNPHRCRKGVPEPYAATSYRTASHDDGGSTDKHAKHADKHRAHRGR